MKKRQVNEIVAKQFITVGLLLLTSVAILNMATKFCTEINRLLRYYHLSGFKFSVLASMCSYACVGVCVFVFVRGVCVCLCVFCAIIRLWASVLMTTSSVKLLRVQFFCKN